MPDSDAAGDREPGQVLTPERPFLAVVAGSKYDTKIRPLYAIYEKVDHLILGGVIYNTYLCAKYDISIKGVLEEDIRLARELVRGTGQRRNRRTPYIVESDSLDGRIEGRFRTIAVKD